MKNSIPFALFNCPIKFNPYQYEPFYKMYKDTNEDTNKHTNKSLYIADEVGLGKTIEAGIIIKEKLFDELESKFLIIAPKFLCKQWKEQLNNLFNIDAVILNKGVINNNSYSVFILPLSQINNFNVSKNNILKNIIIDEAHYFRNGIKSKRYKSIEKIINNFDMKILMSATPINNYSSDWMNQATLLGESFDSTECITHSKKCEAFPLSKIRDIRTVFIKFNDQEQEFYDTTDETANDEFGKTIFRHIGASSLYALNKCYENNLLEFDVNYLDIYEEYIEDFYEENEFEYGALENITYSEFDTKLSKLITILQEPLFNKRKIIIFAHYIETCNHIYDVLKTTYSNEMIFTIKGKMSFDEQDYIRRKFQDYPGKKAILVCSDVCKEGINLQCASILINYDLPFNPAIVEQRIGRIDRVGQKNDIDIYNFVVEGTYDDVVYWEFLLGKLGIIDRYAKLGVMNKLNIHSSGSFIDDFKKSIENAINAQKNNFDELMYIYNMLRKSLKKTKKEVLTKENIIAEINEYIVDIVNTLKDYDDSNDKSDNSLIENIKHYNSTQWLKLHQKKLKDMILRFFGDQHTETRIDGYLKTILGSPDTHNSYRFQINIDADKVREKFVKQPENRKFIKRLISNHEEVYGLLEDGQELIESNKLEVVSTTNVSFEYLNPEININSEIELMDWDKYFEEFIPLNILQDIIKR